MTEEKNTKPTENRFDIEVKIKETYFSVDDVFQKEEKPTLLLHSCCGPCSTAVIERLYPNYKITVFFYNPNITDPKEYEKRKQVQKEFLNQFNEENIGEEQVHFIEGPYEPDVFLKVSRGLEKEEEGGKRCMKCFRLRLDKTVQQAKMASYDYFATTLTVSPHKDYEAISLIGRALAVKYGLTFLDLDFKKKGGFQRSIALSKKYNLYRQQYCGCDFAK